MAKILKPESDFAKRVEVVMQAMEDNHVAIEFCGNEFRFSDTTEGAPDYYQNMILEGIEGENIQTLPSCVEYRLRLFNT